MEKLYNTRTFSQIFPELEDFSDNYDTFQSTAGLTNKLDNNDVAITWQLLMAKYGNNPIANWSEEQFKLKIWQIMFQYGPTWAKRLELQEKARGLTDDEILVGDKTIYNVALAPNQEPSTSSLEEVDFISQQNTANRKKSKMSAYNDLLILLDTDVTEDYLDKFKKLFLVVVLPTMTDIYITDEEED